MRNEWNMDSVGTDMGRRLADKGLELERDRRAGTVERFCARLVIGLVVVMAQSQIALATPAPDCGGCEYLDEGTNECVNICAACWKCVGVMTCGECGTCEECPDDVCIEDESLCTRECHDGCINGDCQDDNEKCEGLCHNGCSGGRCVDDDGECIGLR